MEQISDTKAIAKEVVAQDFAGHNGVNGQNDGNNNLNGSIDYIKNGIIVGWAFSKKATPNPLTITLFDGKEKVVEFVADQFRQDLLNAGYGNGCHGFSVALPPEVFDGKDHSFRMFSVPDNSFIPGEGLSIALTKDLSFVRTVPVEGCVDGVQGVHVIGWAYDPDAPNKPVPVDVCCNGKVIAAGSADLFRSDLKSAGKGNGKCAFRVRIPNDHLDGRELALEVRERADGSTLRGQALLPERRIAYEADFGPITDGAVTGMFIACSAMDDGVEAELWIDGLSVSSFVPSSEFSIEIPSEYMDGEEHEFVLTATKESLVIASACLVTPAVWPLPSSHSFFQKTALMEDVGPPSFVKKVISKIAKSRLFDKEFFSNRVEKNFSSTEESVLYYLKNSHTWKIRTSVWLDPAFVQYLSGGIAGNTISPLEWYMQQDAGHDAGPNPLFSNADYQLLAGLPTTATPEGASYFDDWFARAGTAPIPPSILVDLEHVSRHVGGQTPYNGEAVIEFLKNWMASPPEKRGVEELHPYFDQDWLFQNFILDHHQPKGCLLSAFRLGHLKGISPHPIVQGSDKNGNYYALLKEYEICAAIYGVDDITSLGSGIDPERFYAQFPPQIGKVEGSLRRSSLYCCVTSAPDQVRESFLTSVDDEFVAAEYRGLVEFCRDARGIADINRIWSRWLQPLGVPANYQECLGKQGNLLTLHDLALLRSFRPQTASSVRASFIIPSYGRDDLVLRCVLSTLQSAGMDDIEFLVAEDAVHVDSAWILGYFLPFAKINKNPKNLGFLLSCNEAVGRSSGAIFVLVNNDVIVHKGALDEMLATFGAHPEAAVVGGLILNSDGTVQENGGILWQDGSAWNYHRNLPFAEEHLRNVREVDYVSGCWIGIRRAVWDEIGGFDTRYVPAYCEESDFCVSCWQRGYKVLISPYSLVTHLDGATMGQDENSNTLKAYQKINRAKLFQKWRGLLTTHNKNADLSSVHTGKNDKRRTITLIFDHNIPEYDRDAGSRTIFAMCETLASIENNYVIFIPQNGFRSKYAKALEQLGVEIITGAEGWKRFDTLLAHKMHQIKYVLVSRIDVAKHFTWHLQRLQCRKSLYIHDIDVLREFPSDPHAPGYTVLVTEAMKRYADRNRDLFSKFDHIISCSEDETELLKKHVTSNVVDIFPYNHKPPPAKDTQRREDILFVGSYNHPPNREAIEYFLSNVWPDVSRELPGVRLHICGSGFENSSLEGGGNVIVHGQVTDQTLTYLYSISRAAIAPLLTGAGIKGKVIEACANGVPCVGSSVAWQGLGLPAEYSYLAGGMADFAERLVTAWRRFDGTMSAALVQFHEQCRNHNNINDVLPRLMKKAV